MWRPATPADDQAILEMCRELYREDPSPEPAPEGNAGRTLARLRAEPERGRAAVLEVDGRQAGYALLISFWSNELGGEVCVIDELFVRREHRGQGHASGLIRALREASPLWPSRPVAVTLEVTPQNTRARALYESLGFTPAKNAQMRLRMAGLLCAVLAACASGCATARPRLPAFDLGLVRPYSFDLEKREHLEVPYVARYRRDGRTLRYVATDHLSLRKGEDPLQSRTLTTIRKQFTEGAPQVVIIEGFNTGDELSPKLVLDVAAKCQADGYRGNCGESTYAVNLARAAGSEVITGEPRDSAILKELLAAGFSAEDVLGFYLVRQIPQLRRQGDFSPKTFPAKAEELLPRFRQRLETDVKFGYEDFKSWYSAKMRTPASFFKIENDDTAPHGGPEATYIQRISHEISHVRDRGTVQVIERMLERYDRVMIVFGASHLLTQEPALDAALGKAEYFR